MNFLINHQERKILEILSKDYRTPQTSIARKIKEFNRFAVKKIIRKLFKEGIIKSYTIIIDTERIQYSQPVFFEFKTNPHEPWLARSLEAFENCEILDGITGEYSLIGRFRFTNNEHFNNTLEKIDRLVAKTSSKKFRVVNVILTYKEFGTNIRTKENYSKINLDKKDLKILTILQNQWKDKNNISPITYSMIGERIGLSQPTVYKRIKNLEQSGIIKKFTILIDYKKLGLPAKFYTRIKSELLDNIEKLLEKKEIFGLYRTGEEYGMLAIVRTSSIYEYNKFILKLYEIKGIIDTYTTVVLQERKYENLYLQ